MTLEEIVQYVDFTSLNSFETDATISSFVDFAKRLEDNVAPVAGLCTYSVYSELLQSRLSNSSISSVVVVGGFPHSQIPLQVKLNEIDIVTRIGIDEIDFVVSHHLIHSDQLETYRSELNAIRNVARDKVLKVILETGHIDSPELLREVTKISCEEGMDFIKTSTGKIEEGADEQKFQEICDEIKRFELNDNKKVGIKVSGGVRSIDQANGFIQIVRNTLGDSYLDKKYFRIGASSLLNTLIK